MPARPDTQALIDAGNWREAAELALKQGDEETALALFEELLDYSAAGEILAARGELTSALRQFLRAKNSERVLAIQRALIASLSDDLQDAAEILAEHRRFHEAAELAASSGRHARAAALFREAQDYLASAELFERIGDLREAGSLYERHLEGTPVSRQANLGLGRILQRLERHIDACDALHRVGGDDVLGEEARARLTLSLLELRLVETARLVVRGHVAPELVGIRNDMQAVSAAVKALYGVEGGGFSERYRVLGAFSGPFPESYIALDTMGEQRVLLQPLHGTADARQSYVQTQHILSEPPIPGALPLVDADDRQRYVVFEAPGGRSACDVLVSEVPTAQQARSIGLQILDTLEKAHRRGVLHGSLNPWAVYFRPGWSVAVVGFDVGVLGSRADTATAGGIDNPLSYLAPEVAFGRDADYRTDFYGLGAVMHRLICGEPPIGGVSFPPEAAALGALLESNPDERPPSHAAIRQLIAAIDWSAIVMPVPAASAPVGFVDGDDDADRYVEESREGEHVVLVDRWLGRRIERLGFAEDDLSRLRQLAQPDLAGLQRLLSIDRETMTVDLALGEVEPLSVCNEGLSPLARARVLFRTLQTIRRLHASRVALGGFSVDDIRVDRRNERCWVALAEHLGAPAGDGFVADRSALAMLSEFLQVDLPAADLMTVKWEIWESHVAGLISEMPLEMGSSLEDAGSGIAFLSTLRSSVRG